MKITAPNIDPQATTFKRVLNDLFTKLSNQINGLTEGRIGVYHTAASAAPTSGTYITGDVVPNSARAIGLYMNWIYNGSIWCGDSQIGALKNTTGNRPTKTTLGLASDSGWVGYLYLDTTLDADGKPIWWNGAAWVDATGATV